MGPPKCRATGILSLLFGAACLGAAPGADAGAGDTNGPFGMTRVWNLHLTFSAQAWRAMEPVEKAGAPGRPGPGGGPGMMDREYPWSTARFEADGMVLSNVAVRFKGNSSYNMSRDGWKRPLRLDFNRGAPGRSWLGTEEVSLNNNVNDATQYREALAYQIAREAGVAAPRTAFASVRLTVEGEGTNLLAGTYTLVEVVEADFLKSRFGTSKGLLLKPERLRGLEYLGEDWSRYVERYDPKTKVGPDETARFIGLTRMVSQGSDDAFRQELETRVDIPAFLRFLAVVAWVGNYDSFVGNGHNYYLFQPSPAGRVAFIPWDQNEAFGGHPGAGPRLRQAEFSILRPGASPNRLIERVLAHPEWMAAYRREVDRLQSTVCATNPLLAWSSTLAAAVGPAVREESGAAWAAFRRVALGEAATDAGPPPGNESMGGPMRRGMPGRGEEGTLAAWMMARWQNVAGELAGTREGVVPSMGRGPGGPGGPGAGRPQGPRLGGPGGLVPPPPRER